MDLRGYGLLIHPSYSPSPGVRLSRVEVDPRIPYQRQRRYSLSSLSLPDDSHWGGMHYRSAFSKAQVRRSRSRSRDRNGRRHRELKRHSITPRNENPGIDLALRNLSQEVNTSLAMFKALVQGFERQIEPLQDWAEDYTLDTIWKNKIRDQFRHKRERERFEGVVMRISGGRESVKDCITKAKALEATWDDRYKIEGQIRTARKALLYCDGIIDLAERAASERMACKQLVIELQDTKCLLGRKKHPWIYDQDSVGEQDVGPYRYMATSRKSRGKKSQDETGLDNERFEDWDEEGRMNEPGYSFDVSMDPPVKDARNDQDGDSW
ncbi:hypothetical protein MFIFM68171_00501 [Madurella fahalii]|uniref:Uncharacterized protein n=1 Tax=Madurella fahalii TaxID=1157608 RepID=A0ABQ0FXS7_9PEZI